MPSGIYKRHPHQGFQKGSKNPMYGIHLFGAKNSHWKGGKIKNRGYVYLYKPNHPFCDSQGYVKRANLVMEKHLGRYIILPEIIHHKGIKYSIHSIKNRSDDRLINLMLFANNSKHTSYHSKI